MTSLPSPYIDDIFWIAVIITPIIVAVKLLLKNRKAFLNLMGCVCSAAAIIVPIMTSFSCCGAPAPTIYDQLRAFVIFIFFMLTAGMFFFAAKRKYN